MFFPFNLGPEGPEDQNENAANQQGSSGDEILEVGGIAKSVAPVIGRRSLNAEALASTIAGTVPNAAQRPFFR